MPIQHVLLWYKRVDHFGTVFGPFRYVMKSDNPMRQPMRQSSIEYSPDTKEAQYDDWYTNP